MKKILFKALLAIGVLSSINSINAQCSLDLVGGIANYSVTSQFSDMAVAPNNALYNISYNSGASGKIYLHTSASVSSTWTPVAVLGTTLATKPAITVSKTGKVYIGIRDEGAGQVGKVYYESAGSFIQLGAAFSGANKVSDISIAFNSLGEEYVAYTDVTNGNLATVKKFFGGAWVAVGTGTVSAGASYYNSLIIDKTDSPVLAFEDMSAGNKVTIMKFNGTTWNAMTSIGTNPTNSKLKLGQNGDYYVGYTESTGNVVVQKYNGSVWAALGSPVTSMSFGANLFDLDLDPNDVPYFICQQNTSYYAVAYKYTGVPTWSNVIGGNLSSLTSVNLNISIDKTGNPNFFYIDQPGNNGINVKTVTSPISISSQPLSVTRCNGQSGSFSVGTVGGAPTSYQWQTLGAGTYTNSSAPYTNVTTANLAFTANTSMNQNQVRCVVNVGCKNIVTNTPTLTVSTPTLAFTTVNPTCFGGFNGSVNSLPSGGIAPYTYFWSPGSQTTQNITSQYAGTYTLNATDAAGCTATSNTTITNPFQISSSFSGNMNVCIGGNTTLTVSATNGVGAYTYSWSPGGSLSSTTSSVVTANPSSTQTYNVQITDSNGCVATNTVMVNVASLPSVSASSGPGTICSGSSSNLNASGSADTYTWNPGNLVGAPQIVSPTSTTTYTVVGTNTLSGCTNSATAVVNVNPLPTVNAGPSRTLTCANTSTTLAGSTTGGVTYSWTGPGIVSGATTLNPTINAAGTYDLTVTSAFGCVAGPSPAFVSQDITPPSPTASTSGTLTCSTLTVPLNGAPGTGVTYLWSGPGVSGPTTTQNTAANAPGTYTLTVINSVNGCTATANTNVTQNIVGPNPFANSSTTITCSAPTTTLTALPSSGVTYLWSGPGITGSTTTQTTTANAGGNYTLAITSLTNGCSSTFPLTVSQNTTSPTITSNASPTAICVGGSSNLNASGTSDTYTWNPGGLVGSAQVVSPASTTNYTVIGTNTLTGCTNSVITTVNVNALPTLTTTASPASICVGSTSTLTGTGANTYTWNPGALTTASIAVSPGATTIYTLTGASAAGCVNTKTISLTVNAIPSLTTNASSSICSGQSYTFSAIGATTYTWNPGALTGYSVSVSPGSTTTYTVSGATSGCIGTKTVNLIVNSTPFANAGPTRTLTCANTSTTLAGSGTGLPSYSWNGPGIVSGATTANPTINLPGVYSLTVTSGGCTSAPSNVTVTQNTVAPATSTNVSGTLNCTLTSVNASASTAASPVTYNWTGSGITSATNISTITVNSGGIKNYTVTNTSNGCVTTGSLNVSQNLLAASPTASSSGTITCVTNTVQLNGTPGAGVTYTWSAPGGSSISSGINSQNAIGNGSGNYTLTVTMISSACMSSANVTVIQNTVSPNANAGLDQSLTCASPTVTLNGSASPSSCTPVWTGGVASGANSFNATASTPGTYTLTVTNPANGCSASDDVNVTTNAGVPTIIIAPTNTLTCSNTTETFSASTSAALPTYLWTGPSIVSGATTANAIVDQPGSYTLTVTDVPTGCSATSNIFVAQDITLPNVTIVSSPSVICSGNSSILTGNGAVTYTWSTAQNTTSISVSPTTTDSYTVYGTGTNGCMSSTTETITVNATPVLSISGDINICNGSSTTLTGNGATSYTWDSGANTTTISVTPTITTTYTLTGDNGNGCSSLLPVTVSIIANKSISGVITNTAGATGGDITLYKYTAALSHWDSLTITPIGGTYSFNNIDSGLYVLRAIPTATNIQVTYADSSISWQDATVINHGCTNNTTQNIKLIALAPYVVGPGVLTGNIVEAFGFVPKMNGESKPMVPGTPIGGIIVKGGKNPGGQMFVQTATDAAGNYTLTGLPINTFPDDYFIFVDIPGLDTNSTYYHISVTGSTPITGFDFNVDAQYINPIGTVTGISNDKSVLENKIILFPNPANDKFTLEYELTQSANVQIELYDMIGHKVKSITPNSFEEKNKYSHSVNLEDLSTGVYFVKVKINNSQTTIKLVISN